MIRTEIYIENQRLDLTKDISTEFTYAIDDIKDFASRNTSFSKTIVIPGNDANNKLFGHIFKFGSANAYNQGQPNVGYNFNAAKSASCYIYVDKIQIFKGVLRLLEVIIDGDKIEYECAVFGELGGFISALGNSKLEDIDFGIANQNWNELTIADSWNNVSGGGVYYPLIDYGQVSTNKADWDFKAFKPALYVKQYMDKIITGSGYTYSSTFFTTNLFKRLIIPSNATTLTTDSSNAFYANANVATYNTDNYPNFTTTTAGNFTLVGSAYRYNGATTFSCTLRLRLEGDFTDVFPDPTPSTDVTVSLQKNGTDVASQTFTVYSEPQGYFVDFSYATSLSTNDTINAYLTSAATQYTVDEGALWVVSDTISQVPVGYNEPITINNCIPKGIFQRDFFASIVKMFNLYVTEDKNLSKHLNIEPYIDYYDTTGTKLDWTYKVDHSKVIRLKPMSELNGRYFEFKYKTDVDYYNEQYFKKYAQAYGDFIEDTGYEFANDKQTAEVIFASTPLVGYTGQDKVYSTILKLSNTNVEDKTEHTIRILQAKKITGVTSYAIKNGATTLTTKTDYGYAGHLNDPDAPTADINFGSPRELYFVLATAYPSANLYNGYWSENVAEITDKDSKLLTCNMLLKESDIYGLDFSKLIYINGRLWRINKIMDYNPMDLNTTKVEFLKVIELTYA